ncbi:MAG: type II toxin-antitoxin system HigB family toxin [Deltaproteobacteria bacterium]|nr:type II toxin-antitoxin system HigB family toxin [Deltaproteobacteria bacterium]
MPRAYSVPQKGYEDAKPPIFAWYWHTLGADWSTPADVKGDFRSASILRDGRVVFSLGGNKYRPLG